MGIINVNKDSFYAPSRAIEMSSIMLKVNQMFEDGAAMIDLGAMSSKPGSMISLPEEEVKVLIPVIVQILKDFPNAILSIDTVHSSVASQAMDHGASIINDISGGNYDTQMLATVANGKVPFIMMHIQGLPATMHLDPKYDDVVLDIMRFFSQQIRCAKDAGITDIVIDPGFGFGKNATHNFDLIKSFEAFEIFGLPTLAGISRKSMIYRTLDVKADEALNGTTALHMVLLQKGAKILRVHDVKEAVQCIKLYERLL